MFTEIIYNLQSIVNFIQSIYQGTVNFISSIPSYVAYLTHYVSMLPSIFSAAIVSVISIWIFNKIYSLG